jgi:hypothetical protein
MTHLHPRRSLLAFTALGLFVVALSPARPAEPTPEAVAFFEQKVRPVLITHCQSCHGDAKQKGGLRLDSKAGLVKGGETGATVVPGDPAKSLLIKAVHYQDDLRMPPKSKLPDAAIADLTTWVKMGAPWPDDKAVAVTKNAFDLNERKKFWCWQPVKPVTPPTVKFADSPLSSVDAFLQAKREASGLSSAPPADKRTLLRRITFDLTGMPPTPDEIDAFLRDESPDALAKVADRLLASPRFGERWARHWLDLVRYAESRGHEFDYVIPNAFQYRDYVIRALNADVPYNQFVTEHVAGDLLEQPRLHPRDGFNESILGTGFWFLGEEVHSPVDIRADEADRFDNRIDVLTKTFLGLTVSCARCHDHKFDAISTKDYYSLFGFLESSGYRLVRFDTLEQNRKIARELWQLRQRDRAALQKALADSLRPGVEQLTDYLLAARSASGDPRKLAEIARERKLDESRLAKWVAYLSAASRDESDLLHAWAKAAAQPDANDAAPLANVLRPMVESGRKRQADAENAMKKVTVVMDYSKGAQWLPDDVSFGPGPVRPGELRFGVDAARPVLGFHERAAAVKDPAWDGLRLAPGSQLETGKGNTIQRPGRTIRTPGFTLTGGKLHYLVRGTGTAYAAVGQHVLIHGPLHGALVTDIKTGQRFQWVTHNLTPYLGQRLHVEFTAADGSDFAVAMVVQGAESPGRIDGATTAIMQLLESNPASLHSLADGYRQRLLDALERVSNDNLIGSADAPPLANWLIQQGDLLSDTPANERLKEVAVPILDAQKKLTESIQRESRLALAMYDGTGLDGQVFIRGSPKALGAASPRRFLEAMAGDTPMSIKQGSGRLELARQMTDPTCNPLIARVMVNRIWQHLFGRGLVGSVDNFGVLGERPTHPELLDYLADRFVKDGWSVKKMIRLLVLTRAYQMSSKADAKADTADPDNRLLHRMSLRRLEGEAIRDAMLAVSGRLDERMYGPSMPVYLTDFQDGRGKPGSGPLDGGGRRSLYLATRRNFLSSFLLAFDTPIPFSTVGKRTLSNVPAQALILMNDPFVHLQAATWAKRVRSEPGTDRERIERMYLSAFARPASEKEVTAALAYLADNKADEAKAWGDLCHVLLNTKEFIFLN